MRSVEQRLKKRHPVKFTACLIWQNQVIEAKTINLSIEGAMLNTRAHQFPINSSIKMRCEIEDQTHEITGIVIHSKNGATGIEFAQRQNTLLTSALKTNKRQTSNAA